MVVVHVYVVMKADGSAVAMTQLRYAHLVFMASKQAENIAHSIFIIIVV